MPDQEHKFQRDGAQSWFFTDIDGDEKGPLTSETITDLIKGLKVHRETLVWRNGMPAWTAAGESELSHLFADLPPTPPKVSAQIKSGIPSQANLSKQPPRDIGALKRSPRDIEVRQSVDTVEKDSRKPEPPFFRILASIFPYAVAAVAAFYFTPRYSSVLAPYIDDPSTAQIVFSAGIFVITLIIVDLIMSPIIGRTIAAIGSFILLLIFGMMFLPIGIFTNPRALFGGNTYWGTGLPACDGAYATEQTRKLFIEIPLVAGTRSFPEEVVDAREISATENKRECRAVVRTSDGKSVRINFTFERNSSKPGEFFYSVNITDPSDLLPGSSF
jgi:hypothetical protein